MERLPQQVILCVDVSPDAAAAGLQDAIREGVAAFARRRLCSDGINEDIGVVCFGSGDTCSLLHEDRREQHYPESEQYRHIEVKYDLQTPTEDILDLDFPESPHRISWIKALPVCIDMFNRRVEGASIKSRPKIQLIVITGSTRVDSREDLQDLCGLIKTVYHEWSFSLTVLYGQRAATPEEDGLDDVLQASSGKAVHVPCGQDLLVQLLRPSTEPRRMSFDWKINSKLKIKVCLYKKVGTNTRPRLTYYYDGDGPGIKTHKVGVSTEYLNPDDQSMPIEKVDTKPGYKYGQQNIPVQLERGALKYRHTEKDFSLIGFADAHQVCRQYFLGESYIVLPAQESAQHQKAFSAIVRACITKGKVAICRFLGQRNWKLRLVALSPIQGAETCEIGAPDSFSMNHLPFEQDLNIISSPLNPPASTESQNEAVRQLVGSLDLDLVKHPNVTHPESQLDPVQLKMQLALASRGGTASNEISDLYGYGYLSSEDDGSSLDAIRHCKLAFNLPEAYSQCKDLDDENAKDSLHLPSLLPINNEDEEIRTTQHYYSALQSLQRAADSQFDAQFTHVFQGLQGLVQLLVTDGGDESFGEAAKCVKAFRNVCADASIAHVAQFNSFVTSLKEKYRTGFKRGFWQSLQALQVSIISRDIHKVQEFLNVAQQPAKDYETQQAQADDDYMDDLE